VFSEYTDIMTADAANLKTLTLNTVIERQAYRFTGTVFYKYDEMRATVKTQKRFNFQLRM